MFLGVFLTRKRVNLQSLLESHSWVANPTSTLPYGAKGEAAPGLTQKVGLPQGGGSTSFVGKYQSKLCQKLLRQPV